MKEDSFYENMITNQNTTFTTTNNLIQNPINITSQKNNFFFKKLSKNQQNPNNKTLKYNKTIVFLGSSNTGKTNIISQFCKNKFTTDYIPTIGVNFSDRTCETEYGIISFNIWDTNGEEIIDEILPTHIYYNADAFAICCSYDNKDSFNNIRDYIFFLQKFDNNKNLFSKPILIIINKNDIEKKMFNKKDVNKIINDNVNLNIANIEINAKNNFNVDFIFIMLTIGIFGLYNDDSLSNYINLDATFDTMMNPKKKHIKIQKIENYKKNKDDVNKNNNNNNKNKKHCC